VGTRRTATLATDDELFSAALQRSPGATILTGTRFTANPANDEELRYDDLQRFFPHSFVADLSKHILYKHPQTQEPILTPKGTPCCFKPSCT